MPKNQANQISLQPTPLDCGRWVRLKDANLCVSAAARIALQARMDAVRLYLPRAALHAHETTEYVHRLRVSTRRVIAALKLYREFLPKRRMRWMRERMKEIRSIAGVARDLDVLILRYEQTDAQKHKRLLKRLEQSREKSQRAIIKLHKTLIKNGKLQRRSEELIASIACIPDVTLGVFARERLNDQAKRFFKLAHSNLNKVHQLHRFRIQAKELRYTIELLRDVLPKEIQSDVYPLICKSQDILGELNDHSIASQRLLRMSKKEKRPRASKKLKRLYREERRKVKATRVMFRSWWTPTFVAEFQEDLNQLLGLDVTRKGGSR